MDGEATEPAMIYVAPPDVHLLVKRGRVRVVRGPRENGYRPAIDPLFRSAAASYGSRVIGVILSGNLDDGSAGAAAIHAAGGSIVIQDPADAMYAGMPRNAFASVQTADAVPLAGFAEHLVRMLAASARTGADSVHREADEQSPEPVDPVELDRDALEWFSKIGVPTGLTCPECNGGIFGHRFGSIGTPRYRCRVGHAFSAETLFAEQKASLEVALWIAIRALEESAELARRMQQRARRRGSERATEQYAREARAYDERACTIRDVLQHGLPTRGEGSGSAIPGYADE